jgi:F0F1-type ATP synthase delta subunit
MSCKEELVKLKDKAPVIHMTFAVPADTEVLQELVAWARTNAHPQSLLSIGMQPSLIGGAYIRTPNHVHDFSMRSMLESKRDIMLKILEGQKS